MSSVSGDSRRERQDLKLAIARGMGLTIEAAAEFSGCSVRKAGYKLKESDSLEVISWVEQLRERQEAVENRVSKGQYAEALEELLSDCKVILKKALKTDDLGVALRAVKQIEDRILGSPTQRLESRNLSAHIDVVQLPEGMVDLFLGAATEYRQIVGEAPSQVLEAEVIE